MRTVIIIPARYASSRYPGKPLVKLLGKEMILWVAELSMFAVGKDNVYVATDDSRISNVVTDAGFNVIRTSQSALTGTDRVAEAAQKIDADIYINVQGDEPLVKPSDILKIRDAKVNKPNSIVNGFCYMSVEEDPNNVNIPKVITTESSRLIYMSRAALPAFKEKCNAPAAYKKQVSIYAFSKQELFTYMKYGRKSEIEYHEDIEILRFIDLGIDVFMVETQSGSLAVDVPADVPVVEAALARLIA